MTGCSIHQRKEIKIFYQWNAAHWIESNSKNFPVWSFVFFFVWLDYAPLFVFDSVFPWNRRPFQIEYTLKFQYLFITTKEFMSFDFKCVSTFYLISGKRPHTRTADVIASIKHSTQTWGFGWHSLEKCYQPKRNVRKYLNFRLF